MTQQAVDRLFRGSVDLAKLTNVILGIDDHLTAKYFYDQYVAYIKSKGNVTDAECVAKSNIGWAFGEGMSESRRAMWYVATGASHPTFGVLAPTMEQAFNAGVQIGEESKRQEEGE